jgi:hypothetical protein
MSIATPAKPASQPTEQPINHPAVPAPQASKQKPLKTTSCLINSDPVPSIFLLSKSSQSPRWFVC